MFNLPLLLFCFSVTAISAEINDIEDSTPDPSFYDETTPYQPEKGNDDQYGEENYKDETTRDQPDNVYDETIPDQPEKGKDDQYEEDNYKDETIPDQPDNVYEDENYKDDQDQQDNYKDVQDKQDNDETTPGQPDDVYDEVTPYQPENGNDDKNEEENYKDDQDRHDNDEGTYKIKSAKDLSPCELQCRKDRGSPVKEQCGKPKKRCKKQCKKNYIGACKKGWKVCFDGMREEREELHKKCSTKCEDQNYNTTVGDSTDSNTYDITTVEPHNDYDLYEDKVEYDCGDDNEEEDDNEQQEDNEEQDYNDEGTYIDNIKSAKDLSQCERKCRKEEGSPVRNKCGMPKKMCKKQCKKRCSSKCHKSWKICFDGMEEEREKLHRECSAECSKPVDQITDDFEPSFTYEGLPNATCKCNGKLGDDGRGECEMHTADRKQSANNLFWCFVDSDAECSDKKPSRHKEGWFWSMEACKAKEDLMD